MSKNILMQVSSSSCGEFYEENATNCFIRHLKVELKDHKKKTDFPVRGKVGVHTALTSSDKLSPTITS